MAVGAIRMGNDLAHNLSLEIRNDGFKVECDLVLLLG